MFDNSKKSTNGEELDLEDFPTRSKSDSILSRKAPKDPSLSNGRKIKYSHSKKLEDTSHGHSKLKEAEPLKSLDDILHGGTINEKPLKPKIIDAMKSKSDASTSHKPVRCSIIK